MQKYLCGRCCGLMLLVVAMLGAPWHSQAQLPPEITADAHLRQAEQAIAAGDREGARAVVEKIIALRNEHDLDVGAEHHYWYAVAADALGMPGEAFTSVVEYLSAAGRDGEHYVAALDLMNKVQGAAACEAWDAPEREDNFFSGASPEQVAACLGVGGASLVADDGFTPLHYAAAFSDRPEIAKLVLDAGADLEAEGGRDNRRPLHSAAESTRSPEVVSLLLSAGAEPSAELGNGVMPVHLAAASNENPDVVKLLLSDGELLEEKAARDEWTPLHYAAARNGSQDVVRSLLEAGANLEAKSKWGRTPTVLAARNENLEIIRVLLAAGGDVGKRTGTGRTALHEAAMNKNSEMVRLLLSKGLEPSVADDEGVPAALDAAGNENLDVLKLLWADGIALDAESRYGGGLIHHAAGGNTNCEVIEFLLDKGVDLLSKANGLGWNAMHFAALNGGGPGMVECLLNKGLGVDIRDGTRAERTPLQLASWAPGNDPAVVRALIEAGANVHARTADSGETPLHLAVTNRANLEEVRALLDGGAEVNVRRAKDGGTPLHEAADFQRPEVVRELIEAGASVSARDSEGRTPLHLAAGENAGAVVRIFVGAGASLKAVDKENRTALHYAVKSNAPEVVRSLLDAGATVDHEVIEAAVESEDVENLRVLVEAGSRLEGELATDLLNIAVWKGGPEVVRYLVEVGAELEPKIVDGTWPSEGCFTPLHHAAESGRPEIVRVLIEMGANLGRRTCDEWGRRLPLHLAAEKAAFAGESSDFPGVVAVLVEAGADLEATDDGGQTALHMAAGMFGGSSRTVDALLDVGANPKARDPEGRTPLSLGAGEVDAQAISNLIEAGAEVQDRFLLSAARWNDDPQVVAVLVEAGADLATRGDWEGVALQNGTALHFAAARAEGGGRSYHDSPDFVAALVEAGATLEARDRQGRTALHLAAEFANPETVQALLEAGADVTAVAADGATVLTTASNRREVPSEDGVVPEAVHRAENRHRRTYPGSLGA